MSSKTISKTILVLSLLLIVIVAASLLDKSEMGRWVKSVLANLNPLKAGISLNLLSSEEPEITSEDIDMDKLLAKFEDEEKDETERAEAIQEPEVVQEPPKQLTVEEIQKRVDKIEREVSEISQKVDRLHVLAELRKEVGEIGTKANEISQKVQELGTLARAEVDGLA